MTPSVGIEQLDEASDDDAILVEWAAQMADRIREGKPVDLQKLAQEHPEQAGALRRLAPAIELMAGLGDSFPPALHSSLPGAPDDNLFVEECRLGDFHLLREVGRGGMGVVYEAQQVSLGRRVALKVLPQAAALDPRQLQRFRVEAQAAAGLHHTHIVPVFAVGTERGVHFYAMQFIDGRSLGKILHDLRSSAGLKQASRHGSRTDRASLVSRPPTELIEGDFNPEKPGASDDGRDRGASRLRRIERPAAMSDRSPRPQARRPRAAATSGAWPRWGGRRPRRLSMPISAA